VIENNLYIACLNLSGRRAVVVGAGRIGLEKIRGLLECDADVVVVAPEAHDEVKRLATDREVTWKQKRFDPADLDRALLVVAATSDTALNTAVYQAAEERSMLVNVVDVPTLCNFVLPAIARRGPIAVAVSTSGASPALAKRIKREVEDNVGPEYALLATMLDEQRGWAKATLPTYDHRKEFFESIVAGNPDPIELLRNGDVDGVNALIEAARRAALGRVAPG